MLILSMINYPVDSIMYHCHNGVIKKNEFKFNYRYIYNNKKMPKKSKKGGNAHKKSKNTQKKKERNWTYDELMELGGGFAVVTGLSGVQDVN